MTRDSTSTPIDKPVTINLCLKIAEARARVKMNDPGFEELTAAEKLNDSEYRSEVYRAFPNEPTCRCVPMNAERSSTPIVGNHESDGSFLVCPGGCKKSCCTSGRHLQAPIDQNNGNDDKHQARHCVENQRNSIYNCYKRMRGGGEEVEPTCQSLRTTLRAWNSWNVERDEAYETPLQYRTVSRTEAQTYWHSRLTDRAPESRGRANSPIPNCRYDLKRPLAGHQGPCTRRPCPDVNCLMRALKEAQEFVDSLGKVPGMAGLGLADFSDSLYFKARKHDWQTDQLARENPSENIQYTVPGNYDTLTPLTKTKPFTIAVPGRGGIVQEVLPPKAPFEAEKTEQDTELGPCGKSQCKSRMKKVDRIDLQAGKKASKMSLNEPRKNSKKAERNYRFNRRRERKYFRRRKFRSEPARKINYVYFAGETYPGRIYGHKNCNNDRKKVPPNMGWLWTHAETLGKLKPRVGWKPGAISRSIRELIREGKAGLLERDSRPGTATSGEKRKFRSRSHVSLKKGYVKKIEEDEKEAEPPPTLRIQKRSNVYYFTMYPIKDETMDVPKLEEPINPLQFKILRKRDDSSDTLSSTDSDMDIEFSPPAAVNRLKKMPDVVHVETQVKQQEILDAFATRIVPKMPIINRKPRKKRKKSKH